MGRQKASLSNPSIVIMTLMDGYVPRTEAYISDHGENSVWVILILDFAEG